MTDSTTILLLMPEIILIATATLIYVLGAFVSLRWQWSLLAAASLLLAGIWLFGQSKLVELSGSTGVQASGPLVFDLFGYTVRWGILGVGLVLVMMLARARRFEQSAEEVASLLLMLAGLMIVAVANELILLFVGLELVSIPTYVLLYVGRHDEKGQEAASKYFFLSILSSAVLLYGFSFLYGIAGSTRLPQIAQALAGTGAVGSTAANFSPILGPLAMLLIFAGLAFRLTVVPFHFYAPDVYQGTSHANAGVLSTLPKIAGLAVLARILIASMPGADMVALGWKITLVISVLSMTLGNMLALWQNNIRRMLAYSSIAHAGYLLIGVAVALAAQSGTGVAAGDAAARNFDGLGSAVFYLGVYMFATLGAFAALGYLSSDQGRQIDTLDEIAGLNRRNPLIALTIAVFMFSLTGIPPFAGFWGKFILLFSALTLDDSSATGGVLLRPWFIGLAVVAVLNAAIGAAYYLRVIGVMYFRAPQERHVHAQRGVGPALAILTCAAVVLGVGFMPAPLLSFTNRAGRALQRNAVRQAADVQSPAEPAQMAMKANVLAP